MKLKKIVSLGLISTLSLSILSGCSKKEDKSREGNKINYVKGANIGGFIKVAEAMCAQGHC